jgi:hypothetical protein
MYQGLPWLVGHTFVTWHTLIGFVHVIYYFTQIKSFTFFIFVCCKIFFNLCHLFLVFYAVIIQFFGSCFQYY